MNREVIYASTNSLKYDLNDSYIKKIGYHEPSGPGDQHYIDIYYSDGTLRRCFDLKYIDFKGE